MRNWLNISHGATTNCLGRARDETIEKSRALGVFYSSFGCRWSDIDCLTSVKYPTMHCGRMLIGVEGVVGGSDRAHERRWLGLSATRDVALIWLPFSRTEMKQMLGLLAAASPRRRCPTCASSFKSLCLLASVLWCCWSWKKTCRPLVLDMFCCLHLLTEQFSRKSLVCFLFCAAVSSRTTDACLPAHIDPEPFPVFRDVPW